MRLESITLQGFKSFGEKAVVKVLPGITGIVGPNGCGKSNISEGVRWALGEQSAKSLRGQRMEDLIFHGSASRKAVGLAEVELSFSNDGDLAVPFSEIAVSRRLYRTGESEYVLNKAVCRLRDILDLLAGTGANPRAYAVMDQDKLNHVLTAKPNERRVFIEEAAGIARYKQQRTETQGKLDATRQNLARVRDVMDEVKRQLGSLERQARKAQQYKALQSERREMALALVAADYAALTAEAAQLAAEVERLSATEEVATTRLAGLAAQEAGRREAIQQSEHRLGDLRQGLQKIQGEFERLLERREQLGVQRREASEESDRLEREIAVTTERAAALVDERATVRQALADAEARAADRAAAAHELAATVEQHRTALQSERDRLEALRLEQMRLAAERTDLIREAGELRERQSQLARRAERLASETAEAEAEATRLAGHRAEVEIAREHALQTLSSLAAERARLETMLAERETGLAQASARLAELRVQFAARRSSLESIRELERIREGYGAGVRAVFAEGRTAGLSGVVGTVADLLDVPQGLERAVEAVLGERLQWVVVERFEDARAGVAFLDREQGGSATFLPLENLGHGGAPDTLYSSTGLRWAAGEVTGRAASLVQYLLGNVAIVDHLDVAEALWRRNGVVATYATPGGEVLSPTGRLRGGSGNGTGAEQSLLARKRQLRELETDVERLTTAIDGAQEQVARLEADAGTLRAKVPLLREAISSGEATRLASEKDLEQSVREHERIHRHLETIGLESFQVHTQADETTEMLGRLERRIEAARDAEAAHETAMGLLRAGIEDQQARDAEMVATLTACRVEMAAATEKVDALGRELARMDEIERDLTERITQGRARHDHLVERGTWLEGERQRTDGAAHDVALERDAMEHQARAAAEQHESVLAALRELDSQSRALESEIRALTGQRHDIELRATADRVRLEELVQDARRSHGVDEADLPAKHDPERDLETVRQRLGDLDEKLATIGPVNLVADEEYRELEERLEFLRAQHDDLTGSLKDLEKALRGMTRTAQERFAQAFEEISVQFAQIFQRLFEGGRAELRLVEAEEGGDLLDTGVELMAQPRGKRLQSVTLLSGGERALTGLALLFAIFYYRPSPFCVLDEVDAPLDDANIHRFLRVLQELTSQTQFLVITHNRETMEAADVLYGVTMEEPGLSKLVSVNLNG